MTKQEEYRVKKYFVDALVKADLSVNNEDLRLYKR